jgi:tRNA A37 threonylcarbamoyladenosine dehydratase
LAEALMPHADLLRFSRTERLIGREALDRLSRARVVVVGLGAVGSYAVEGLARAGVGGLRLVDFDEVRLSNINRQLYALESTLGRSKVDVARERVLDINPACEVETLRLFVDAATAARAVAARPDAVIDAIDSVAPKVELLTAAVQAGLVVISSMGAATRTDPLAIRVGDIAETRHCPLARLIRKRLKQRGIGRGIRCIYSVEPSDPRLRAGSEGGAGDAVGVREVEILDRGRPRPPLGSLSCLTGIFGLIAAREALAAIVGWPAAGGTE